MCVLCHKTSAKPHPFASIFILSPALLFLVCGKADRAENLNRNSTYSSINFDYTNLNSCVLSCVFLCDEIPVKPYIFGLSCIPRPTLCLVLCCQVVSALNFKRNLNFHAVASGMQFARWRSCHSFVSCSTVGRTAAKTKSEILRGRKYKLKYRLGL